MMFNECAAALLKGAMDLETDTILAYIVDKDEWPDFGVTETLSDVPEDALVTGPEALTNQAVTAGGWFDSDDVTFASASGNPSEGVLLVNDTAGVLMAFFTKAITMDGNDIIARPSANGWFRPGPTT